MKDSKDEKMQERMKEIRNERLSRTDIKRNKETKKESKIENKR